ncbi:serine/threonine-protein kinase [Streptomyces telluris]|uniref:Serine/threonine-protein kinase n=1 Tax=Streptomyces telluris TaxID=2720021 RepID=A0A9X2RR26_9ACTN|nr:serine/threonine-protein kinase [Streptomyces telluris]MCQ8774854.1 serine/threonine-protein kinase [Streptomyces telluris]NJP76732.1 serine/threonine protein kinase [Streptomyces telluris]
MTPHPLLDVAHVTTFDAYVADIGTIFRTFADQDSGCVSYGVLIDGRKWFVKSASTPEAVSSLRRAANVHQAVAHPAITPLLHSITTDDGLALVYPWVPGEVLYQPTRSRSAGRTAPNSPMARFRGLPLPEVHAALDTVLHAHRAVEAAGLVAVDLYDGCMLYDFDERRMRLCDLDEYRQGPFTLDDDRLPGSSRYMAPEEFVRGSVIDIRTTVFNLGRALRLLLDAGDAEDQWRGSCGQLAVIQQATTADSAGRFTSVRSLVEAWRTAA